MTIWYAVRDLAAARRWYVDILGFEETYFDEDGRWSKLERDGTEIALAEGEPDGAGGVVGGRGSEGSTDDGPASPVGAAGAEPDPVAIARRGLERLDESLRGVVVARARVDAADGAIAASDGAHHDVERRLPVGAGPNDRRV